MDSGGRFWAIQGVIDEENGVLLQGSEMKNWPICLMMSYLICGSAILV